MLIKPYGFTLNQLLITIAIIGIIASIAYPSYLKHTQNTKLREAQAALLENAQHLERFYMQHASFKKNSTTWADLPLTTTDTFCIKPHGLARGATDGKFTLKAVPINSEKENRIIKINETLVTFICESSSSTCDDKLYFSGTDKNCSVYQP